MGIMSANHLDVLEFIHCKDREGDLTCFNISVGLTDEFMRQASDPAFANTPWRCTWKGESYLPRRVIRDAQGRFVRADPVEISARAIFDEIIKSAHAKGEPGVVFLDEVNRTNPLPGLGRIECSNPCTIPPLYRRYHRWLTRLS